MGRVSPFISEHEIPFPGNGDVGFEETLFELTLGLKTGAPTAPEGSQMR